jgi:hypothetical protein
MDDERENPGVGRGVIVKRLRPCRGASTPRTNNNLAPQRSTYVREDIDRAVSISQRI